MRHPETPRRLLPAALGGVGLFYLLGGALLLWGALGMAPAAVSTLRFAALGSLPLPTPS